MASFEPLHVRAWLQCGVVTDGRLPLDGILFYQAHRALHGGIEANAGGGGTEHAGSAEIRLLVHEADTPQWYYAASFAQWPDAVVHGVDYWNKRFDEMPSASLTTAGRAETGKGRYKNVRQVCRYRHALHVDWYAMGERQWVRDMLSHVTNVGADTGQGWGAVLRWEVEPWHADWSVRDGDGRLTRAIPSERGNAFVSYRPSYWMPANHGLCILPS